jgi:hypothetical protein
MIRYIWLYTMIRYNWLHDNRNAPNDCTLDAGVPKQIRWRRLSGSATRPIGSPAATYIHIYLHIHIFIYIYVNLYIYVYTYVLIYIYIQIYI